VLFDTGSGHVLLPHRACKSRACEEHRHYSPWQSVTSMDVDVHGHQLQKEHRLAQGNVARDGVVVDFTQADLGQGVARGVFVRDRVCLVGKSGGEVCAELAVMAAVTEEDVPFREMPNDGIVGLALPSLSAGPACNFFGTLVEGAQGMLPQFGISFGATGGELHIGGHDPASVAAPIQWFPVHSPEEGYWQVPILAVRVGKTTIDACQNGCHAIMDTASSRLGVQKSNLPKLLEALTPVQAADGSCQGPDLEFDLGGMSVTLGVDDYMSDACKPDLGSLDLEAPKFTGVFSFGETVLRHYFVAFNWNDKLMGFAPTRPAEMASPSQTSTADSANQVVVL